MTMGWERPEKVVRFTTLDAQTSDKLSQGKFTQNLRAVAEKCDQNGEAQTKEIIKQARSSVQVTIKAGDNKGSVYQQEDNSGSSKEVRASWRFLEFKGKGASSESRGGEKDALIDVNSVHQASHDGESIREEENPGSQRLIRRDILTAREIQEATYQKKRNSGGNGAAIAPDPNGDVHERRQVEVSEWVLGKIKGIGKFWGVSCDWYEADFMAFFKEIERKNKQGRIKGKRQDEGAKE
ncbi:hypothetical protein F0562_027920 [Nyssa sinensis]|uniref:Uncharacterized protein n=1 Tax=Nyssa sinensis TaxID=561372 RepID=A0A5J5B6K7_9ASTE|nr:hypothetical protein F0562_027920 [Nyssa sinensis]